MTYRKLVEAIPAFQKLVKQDLPLPVAYRLSKIVRRVNEEMEFFRAKQKQIVGRHENPHSPEIVKELDELLNFPVEWDASPLCIPLDEKLRLSCSDVDTLDGFIEFIEKEGGANEQDG